MLPDRRSTWGMVGSKGKLKPFVLLNGYSHFPRIDDHDEDAATFEIYTQWTASEQPSSPSLPPRSLPLSSTT